MAVFRVFVDAPILALRARLRDEAVRAGWRVVERVEDADAVLSAGGVSRSPSTSLVLAAADDAEAPVETLTARERDVLVWLAEGASNRDIATRLGVTEHTVKYHLSAIFGKLGVSTRTAAVRRAFRLGWLDL